MLLRASSNGFAIFAICLGSRIARAMFTTSFFTALRRRSSRPSVSMPDMRA